jgi:hypothetical protein
MIQDFLRELNVAFRASGADIVDEDRLAVAGSLGETNAAGNDGLKDLVLKELLKVGGDLTSEIGAVVIHGEENAGDLEGVIKGAADPVNDIDEF